MTGNFCSARSLLGVEDTVVRFDVAELGVDVSFYGGLNDIGPPETLQNGGVVEKRE